MAVLKTRFLTSGEIDILTKEVCNFPDLIYVGARVWRKRKAHVLEERGELAGVLMAYPIGEWVKLGPLVVLKSHQGKGLGRIFLEKAVRMYRNKNIFVNSTNPVVAKILAGLGFNQVEGYSSLPLKVKLFLLGHLMDFIRPKIFFEAVRKAISLPRGRRKYFIKYSP